jgi:hypothetical protein
VLPPVLFTKCLIGAPYLVNNHISPTFIKPETTIMATQDREKSECHAPGDQLSSTNKVLTTGAGLVQEFAPVRQICAHLNAFHVYTSDPTRAVEATHYCAHVNDEVRQCIIYDSDASNARILGIEYMITPRLYETLSQEERRLWHSHVFEVKSGMLVMPQGALPNVAWEAAETKEMEQVVTLYGKTYHLWQVDRGDVLPLGEPQLMGSFTAPGQLDAKTWKERDERMGVNTAQKRERREHIKEPEVHPDADQVWKKK